MASYPGAVKTFAAHNNGDVIQGSHVNDLQDEVNAIEAGLLQGTAPLNSSNSTVANLSVTGGSTLASLTLGNGQLVFPATQNASAGANTLDDYEEGTWVPALGGSATYTNQAGTYTKVGNMVAVQCHLTVNSIGTGSATTISGLPFNPAALSAGFVTYWASAANNFVYMSVFALTNGTLQFCGAGAAAASITNPSNVFQNTTDLYCGAVYFV